MPIQSLTAGNEENKEMNLPLLRSLRFLLLKKCICIFSAASCSKLGLAFTVETVKIRDIHEQALRQRPLLPKVLRASLTLRVKAPAFSP